MQEILAWILVLVAFAIMTIKIVQSLKSLRKVGPDCHGCGGGCCGCPVVPADRKIAER